MADWINVFKTSNIIDAEMMKAVLSDYGIESVIVNKIDSSLLIFGEATVYCPPEFAEEAKQVIRSNQIAHE